MCTGIHIGDEERVIISSYYTYSFHDNSDVSLAPIKKIFITSSDV